MKQQMQRRLSGTLKKHIYALSGSESERSEVHTMTECGMIYAWVMRIVISEGIVHHVAGILSLTMLRSDLP